MKANLPGDGQSPGIGGPRGGGQSGRSGNVLFFSRRELAIIVAVGIITGLVDDKAESLQFALAAQSHILVLVNDYLAHVTGGPVFGDILETWLEYGAVLAACLVRKPAAATIALTINGICQVFAYGTHDPHLLYGVAGFGADLVFASFRYRRYDVPAVCLAGIACAMFWYPIVWFTHGIYSYPPAFITADLAFRVLGSAVGDGLLGAGLALVVLRALGRKWDGRRPPTLGTMHYGTKRWNPAGFAIVAFGALLIVLTSAFSSVSDFFLSVGPRIPPGIPALEEYNMGYVIGGLLIFLVLAMLVFRNLGSRDSGQSE